MTNKHLVLKTTSKTSDREVPRIFTMNDSQAKTFESAVASIVLGSRVPRPKAEDLVTNMIIRLLSGDMPTQSASSSIHRLRLAFPILKDKDVERMRILGCPTGWITSVNLLIYVDQNVRSVRLDLDADQVVAYNDFLGVMARHMGNRDEAWHALNNLVARLVSGAPVADDAEQLVKDIAEKFPPMSEEDVLAMPMMSDQDLIDYSTRAPGDEAEQH